ncbi:MAG: hypothetical protein EBT75_05750 [Proteobacteria bacterium]|nr:hypothetical protein [Pseudomonadota bacterium]NBS49949.1 hypothetical protein [Verrucomicrobiota bacterium]NBS79688.1 hypothetical protein [bacterium]
MQWMRGIFFSISIFVASNGYARLGETSEAIEKRFNEAVRLVPASSTLPKKLQDRVATRIYQIGANRDGALVEITFLDGVSSREFYFLEREKSQTSRGLNDAQIRFILEVNAQGSSWDACAPEKTNRGTSWKRQDQAASAKFQDTQPTINLNSTSPLESQLLIWSGIELRAKRWDDFMNQAEIEMANLKKQQALEAKKKLEQELADQQLLQGI